MNPRKKTRILVPLNPSWSLPRPGVFKRSLVFAVVTFLRPIFCDVGKIYKLCFGWLNKSAARKNQREFAAEIQTKFEFLFRDHGATVVANDADVPLVPAFDGACVTVTANDIRLRFTQGRGDFLLEVAPLTAPTEWERLDLVLATISDLPVAVEPRDTQVLRTVARLLPVLYKPLTDVLQGERAAETLDTAARIHHERTEEYVQSLKKNGVVPRILEPK